MKYAIHPEAELEANEAMEWYGEADPSLAIEFSRVYLMAIEEISRNPRRYPLAEDSPLTHECRNLTHVGRFPYRVVFALKDDRVLVLAVAHHRRKPKYWNYRVRHRIG